MGCGPAQLACFLADLGVPVMGVALSPGMAAVARARRPGLEVRVGSMLNLPLAFAASETAVLGARAEGGGRSRSLPRRTGRALPAPAVAPAPDEQRLLRCGSPEGIRLGSGRARAPRPSACSVSRPQRHDRQAAKERQVRSARPSPAPPGTVFSPDVTPARGRVHTRQGRDRRHLAPRGHARRAE
ncbi:methyltransferase domain-containing protein [Streptomyces caniferus]|uniref:methyltransferase domain-containing protein n=1 Tax=Streptomyces caniferus TaxID=285557 RepID=UPI00135A2FBD